MRSSIKFTLILLVVVVMGVTNSIVGAQGNSTIADIVAIDARFSRLNLAIQQADLTAMFKGNGPYTLFAPTNEAMAIIDQSNTNALRQALLFHTLQGNFDLTTLGQQSEIQTALGKTMAVEWQDGALTLNGQARITINNIKATNGTIHIIDAVLTQNRLPNVAPTNRENTNFSLTTPPVSTTRVNSPSENPAYVSGGSISYWAGIHSDSSSCKGTTWTLHYQMDGVTMVGSDRATNPYRGDTGCAAALPLLCLQQDYSYPPEGGAHDYYDGWAFGTMMVTEPISGDQLVSRAAADAICNEVFGQNARMAEFHDGNLGAKIGAQSGHDFWAYGGLEVGQRFWVAVNDQPANPWNSVNPKSGPPNLVPGENIFLAGADPAFIGLGQARMSAEEGFSAGRYGCQGNTWVIHKQINGKVQVGGDHSSNPFVGDRPCKNRYPILCIRVDGWSPPPNSHGEDYNYGWSGGWVKVSNAVSGDQI
ncbi:MAG TPA: fasciclin domain-containing protein, partial [Anaerolineae bacterium]|nr:fasciclin domain-containing protein [Anaerolineae bacterium]